MSDALALRVHQLVATVLGKSPIGDDMNLFDDLGADSLELVDLFVECEAAFGITIRDEMTFEIDTVGDLVRIIREAAEAMS